MAGIVNILSSVYVANTLVCVVQTSDKGTAVSLRLGATFTVLFLSIVAAIGRVVLHISNIPFAIHNNCICRMRSRKGT